ncbi:hypothetical protein HN747_02240 [archaeon]|nr:hypothetical protein [archaeon]
MNFVDPSGMWGFKSTERLWKESWASDHGGGEQASNMFWLELPRALLADVIYNLPGSNANRLDSPDMARKDAKFVEFVGSSAGLVAGASAPRVASPGLGRGMPLRNKDLTNILNKELGGGKASLDDIESALLRISDRGDLDPLSARAFIEETKALAYRDIDGLTITPHTAVRFVIRASEKGLGATADDVAQLGTSYIEEMIYFGNSRPLESGARSFTHDGFRLILDIPSKEIKTFEILHKYGR